MRAVIQKGFTLIELMIVVAIISILAASDLEEYKVNGRRGHLRDALREI